VRSLRGVHLTFTGILRKPRIQAARAAKRAGAIVHGGPSSLTTVVVRGRPTRSSGRQGRGSQADGIKRLREKGHRIILLDESRFWKLTARK